MNEEEYLSQRLEEQQSWYDKKSQLNQRGYKRTRTLEIISASLIPLLAGNMQTVPYAHWIIGTLGVVIAISAAVASLNQYQENWLQYRVMAENLSKEKHLYLTKTEPYSDEHAFRKLVRRVEKMLAEENNQWSENMQQEQQKIPESGSQG